nr:MAG TPA: hypothetical protein [Caudoviricetes sp.]
MTVLFHHLLPILLSNTILTTPSLYPLLSYHTLP